MKVSVAIRDHTAQFELSDPQSTMAAKAITIVNGPIRVT